MMDYEKCFKADYEYFEKLKIALNNLLIEMKNFEKTNPNYKTTYSAYIGKVAEIESEYNVEFY